MLLLLSPLLAACTEAEPCELGQVRGGDGCEGYVAGPPLQGDPLPIPGGVTWQWQITEAVDTSHEVDLYDVDLFQLTDAVRDRLLADGRILVCYFSAGSFEPWTDDADRFPEEAIGKPLEGWPDERWLDHTHPEVRQIMRDRMDLAVERGCHGVEPDNVTAHTSRSGFGINATEQLQYNRFLADEAHARDLAVALKNDVEQIPELVDWFDLTVNEECADYDECDTLRPFVEAGKAVLHAEYVDRWHDARSKADAICGVEPGLSSIVNTWDLGPELLACR